MDVNSDGKFTRQEFVRCSLEDQKLIELWVKLWQKHLYKKFIHNFLNYYVLGHKTYPLYIMTICEPDNKKLNVYTLFLLHIL